MKIRTDFVTNSSSSGFVVISVVDGNGEREGYQFEYDTGYGGYFWNGASVSLVEDLDTVRTGTELAKVLLERFEENVLNNDKGRSFIQIVQGMESIRALCVSEDTHYDMGGEDSAELTYRFASDDLDSSFFFRWETTDEDDKKTRNKKDGNALLDLCDYTDDHLFPIEYSEYLENNPLIEIKGKIFVFSGMDSRAGDAVALRIRRRGGEIRENVSGKTDYLVIGPYSFGWFDLKKAVEVKNAGKPIRIIRSLDLKKYLEDPKRYEKKRKAIADAAKPKRKQANAEIRLTWRFDKGGDGGYTITGYKGNDRDIVIPDIIGRTPVTAIGERCFFDCFDKKREEFFSTELHSVTIPATVTYIGKEAFRGCHALQTVIIPDSVETIDLGAFSDCCKLEQICLPKGLRSIGEDVFFGCFDAFTIPAGVEQIVKLSDKDGCTELLAPKYAFNLPAYKAFYVEAASKYFRAIDGVLFSADLKRLVRYPLAKAESEYKIPEGVEIIEATAFGRCSALQSVVIPDTVKIIDFGAFAYCEALQTVSIPNSVTTIGDDAFKGCVVLQAVSIPNSVTTIGAGAFAYCKALQAVDIPDSVTTIATGTFAQCDTLKTINIPNSVTMIGNSAIWGCKMLQAVSIPDSVTTIGDYAFDGCVSLQAVSIPDSVTTLGDHAFYGCVSLQAVSIPDSVTTIGDSVFACCKVLQTVSIPNSVTTIGDYAFYGCVSLQAVSIPDSVTTIGNDAFYGCVALQAVSIPNSVTTIGNDAFYGCVALQAVSIPNSVTTIGAGAFAYCKALQAVDIPDSVTTIGKYAFVGCDRIIKEQVQEKLHKAKRNKVDPAKLKSETAKTDTATGASPAASSQQNAVLTPPVFCPVCGEPMKKYDWGYGCTGFRDGCRFSVGTICEKLLTEDEFRKLINERDTGRISGFISKAGKPFRAHLILDEQNKVVFKFENPKGDTNQKEKPE